MMYKRLSYLLLTSCLVVPAIQAETLLDLYALAKENDAQLKVSGSDRLIALEAKPQAQASLLPQVVLGADATESWNTENWMSGSDTERTALGYSVSLSYPLYRRDRQILLEQADIGVKIAEESFASQQQALIQRLSSAYFTILNAEDNLRFTRSAREAFRRQLDQTQQRFDVGLIAITDVKEAQSGFDQAVSDEITAQNTVDQSYESLREITGSYHKLLATLKADTPLLPPDPQDIDAWTKTALEQNPQVIVQLATIENARQEVERQRAGNLPTVDLTAQHAYNDTVRGDESNGMRTNNSIGVSLSYSLYEGGAIRSKIREAQQRYVQELDRLEQVRRSIQNQTHTNYLNVLSGISRVKASRQAVESALTALEAIETGFDVGTRTSVDVLNARRDLLDAQRNYSQSRYQYVLSTVTLKQSAGLLRLEDLVAINNWLTTPSQVAEPATTEKKTEKETTKKSSAKK
ncbi:TolC family outer membrane protein [Beggiatoa leptomitoformis]|uniref:TolC family outer membrane protein n=1 Tax=Beggiatoa leptomitoformis TaxID=288004 RepID=A0A2N9YH42_9GAMM|nr:TolC family outer membrane protein [Beggiatoa leptomitoformis]AUI69705.1 TolC family outer membrane protein [Beggiatoa leptomitoformis]QGX03691.1 TolC family outer membrane protein [Beggiatoa leptomitoformis]